MTNIEAREGRFGREEPPARKPPAPTPRAQPPTPPQRPTPTANKARLFMRQFCCDKTTEAGADEPYILVTGKRSDGQVYSQRIPSDVGHWDMNDGDQPNDNPNGDSHCVTNKSLFSGDLAEGQSWNLVIVVMEEDGGTSEPYQKIAAIILQNVDNPYAEAAGVALDLVTKLGVHISDTDDYLGSFAVRITNNGGSLQAEWKAVDRIDHSIPDPEDAGNSNKREFRMNGDGSNYVGWFHVL